ncbi:MAG: DMT family transporter [Henriciella sp.]|nr:DMT family transporter [Henriciella sp.]MBO6694081.1 DMT family transporter [Henriciella sp.]
MPIALRLFLITTLVMIAFAANSVLGRLGLIGTDIGAGSFALIRLISGAAVLLLICTLQRKHVTGTWAGGVALLAYAAFFSYAYIALSAGMGAVILFALVQLTMLGWGLFQGERLSTLQWAGFVVAIAALVWLVSPSIEAPPLLATAAMAIAGMGWGAYSLLGRGVSDPTAATAGNFLRASALGLPVLALAISFAPEPLPPTDGILIAVVSGAVTSGLGYVIWYSVVKQLSASRAGIAQLSVPAIAAIGGVLFLSEPITLRFALSTLAILGGVGLAVLTAAPGSSKASE